MKETYKVEVPKHIVFGDPLYFEREQGAKLKKLIVDIKPPKDFEARIVLEEVFDEEIKLPLRSMSLYMAPAQYLSTYMKGMYYKGQVDSSKRIGVDSAKYLLKVNERELVIRTGGDGYWGEYCEYSRKVSGKKITDAQIIDICIPDDYSFGEMQDLMKYFFPNYEQVENISEDSEADIKPSMG